MNTQKPIPPSIAAAVDALLAPYGVSLSAIQSASGNLARYMTAKQAAAYCGLSAKTIRDKALAGAIESRKIGRSEKSRVLIDRASLERWIDSFSTGAGSQ